MDKVLSEEDKRKFLVGFIPAIVSLFIYLSTLARVVTPQDSGEFIAASYTLGICHPPGYPLYTIIGKLFTYIPFGSIAFRVSLMSAFFASLTIYFLYTTIYRLTKSVFAGVTSSLVFAFSLTFWSQSVISEVYTLNSFFFILCIYILVVWSEKINDEKSNNLLYLLSFIYGLSLTNHQTMLLFGPPMIFWILYQKPKILTNGKIIVRCIAFFLLGLSVYLVMPIRSQANPYIDWGNTENFENFLRHIARYQYRRVEQAPRTISSFLTLSLLYFKILFRQFSKYLAFLPFLGIPFIASKRPKFFVFVLISFIFLVFVFIFITNLKLNMRVEAEVDVFFINSFLLLALIFSFFYLAIEEIFLWLNVRFLYRVITLILLFSFLFPAFSNVKYCDKRNYYFADDLALNTLMTLKPNAIFFPGSDESLFVLWYYQLVLGRRPDVKVISTTTHLWRAEQEKARWPDLIRVPDVSMYKSGKEYIVDLINFNIDRYPIYAGLKTDDVLIDYFNYLVPEGMLYRFLKTDNINDQIKHMENNMYLWNDYIFRGKYKTSLYDDFFTKLIISEYALAHDFSGLLYYKAGRLKEASREFKKAKDMAPDFNLF